MLWPVALLYVYHYPLFESNKRVDKLVRLRVCTCTYTYAHITLLSIFTIELTDQSANIKQKKAPNKYSSKNRLKFYQETNVENQRNWRLEEKVFPMSLQIYFFKAQECEPDCHHLT